MGEFFNSSQFDVNTNVLPQGETEQSNTHAHVSLSQIVNLTRKEDGLIIHRQKINTLTTIGIVITVDELTTKNVYRIDDYTFGAPIEVQLWKNSDDEGIYVLLIFK